MKRKNRKVIRLFHNRSEIKKKWITSIRESLYTPSTVYNNAFPGYVRVFGSLELQIYIKILLL